MKYVHILKYSHSIIWSNILKCRTNVSEFSVWMCLVLKINLSLTSKWFFSLFLWFKKNNMAQLSIPPETPPIHLCFIYVVVTHTKVKVTDAFFHGIVAPLIAAFFIISGWPLDWTTSDQLDVSPQLSVWGQTKALGSQSLFVVYLSY